MDSTSTNVPHIQQPEPQAPIAVPQTDWLAEAIKREATPKRLRQETADEFSARFGIDIKQYYYQMSKKENKERVLEIALNKAKDSVPEILDKLVELALEGEMKAIDTYLDSIIKLAKNLDVKSDGKPIFVAIPASLAKKNGIQTHDETQS